MKHLTTATLIDFINRKKKTKIKEGEITLNKMHLKNKWRKTLLSPKGDINRQETNTDNMDLITSIKA